MAFWGVLKWFLNKGMDSLTYHIPVAFLIDLICSVIGIPRVIHFMYSALSRN